jgi:hypothetical protein
LNFEFEERAAILEFDAGFPRHIAEAKALDMMLKNPSLGPILSSDQTNTLKEYPDEKKTGNNQ